MAKQKKKETIEIEVGTKPKTTVKSDKIGKTHPMPEKGGDVTGQAYVQRLMRCWNCGGISHIWYDTCAYHYYTCCYCGATSGPF
jgi:hypothetical protein